MSTLEQRYAKLLELTKACSYYLEGTDNDDPVALVSYLDALPNEVPVVTGPTSGHCANSGGIRGHSAGDIFPAVIVIKGSFKLGFRYHVLNHPAINPLTGWGTYKTATTIASMRSRDLNLLSNPTNT